MTERLNDIVINELTDETRQRLNLPYLLIHGVEVTQGIQHWHSAEHLTDPGDRGPDNSIRLVAGKLAYVRVYVRSLGEPIAGVVGEITVQVPRYGFWVDHGKLDPQPPVSISTPAGGGSYLELGLLSGSSENFISYLRKRVDYARERGDLSRSLNFLVPTVLMRGRIRLKIHVEVPGTAFHDDTEVDVDASLSQTLRVRGIPVRYEGDDGAGKRIKLSAPALSDFQTTAAFAVSLFPVSQIPDISLAGIFTWTAPLTGNITTSGGTSSCPRSWDNLLTWLGVAKALDGNRADHLYYALLPSGIPTGNASGCGGGGSVGAGFINDGQTMAHELGHILGLAHAPCGLVTGDMGDPNYPAYEPYDAANNKQASIGEYGLDPAIPTIYPPNTTRDFMSYCTPRWISPYHYRKLIMHDMFDPHWVTGPRDSLPPYVDEQFHDWDPRHIPDPPPPWVGRRIHQLSLPDPERSVVVTGVLDGGQLEIRSVLRISTAPITNGRRIPGARIELLDPQGQVVRRAGLRLVKNQATCGCGCHETDDEEEAGIVQALLPEIEQLSEVRLVQDDEVVWSRSASSEPPVIVEFSADVDGEMLVLRWQVQFYEDSALERHIRWSVDEGQSWQTLAVALQEDEAELPVSVLTSGPVMLQVLVSDGFYTVESEPVYVDIPVRPPQVAILAPAQGSVHKTGDSVRLLGMAIASDGRALSGEALQWELDGETAGSGNEVWGELAGWDGEHRAILRAVDGDLSGEASVTFLATCSGTRPVRLA